MNEIKIEIIHKIKKDLSDCLSSSDYHQRRWKEEEKRALTLKEFIDELESNQTSP